MRRSCPREHGRLTWAEREDTRCDNRPMPGQPLYTQKPSLIDTSASYLLTEDGVHLLTEDGSDLLITNSPSPLTHKKPPLIVP
jgi:hypothetical protein